MKKLLFIIACFIIPVISFASVDINLKYGTTHTQVKELQEFLIGKGFLTGDATGNFFTLTRKAVVAYQGSVGLPTTGYVGPMTREKINTELSLAETTSNTAEVTETGTISSSVNTKNDTLTALQNQINALIAQLQELTAQAKTQTATQQQIQQSVQGIQQNIIPASVPSPTYIPPTNNLPEFKINRMFFWNGGTKQNPENGRYIYIASSVELDISKIKFLKPAIKTPQETESEDCFTSMGFITTSKCFDWTDNLTYDISVVDGVDYYSKTTTEGWVYHVVLSETPVKTGEFKEGIYYQNENFAYFKVQITSTDGRPITSKKISQRDGQWNISIEF